MSKPLVTVVIAIYNIEDYLEPCLKSILSQTYQNLEIFAIDDGSTDGSSKILKEYTKKDPRLKIITQKNSGLSVVRNHGLELAKGEYVCFIDGDDHIAPDYVKKLVSAITKTDADISVCGYAAISKDTRRNFTPKAETLSGKDATIRLLISQENLDIVTWNKLYKRELFLKNNIIFPPQQLHEDSLTTYKLYSKAEKVAFVDQPLYFYYERPGSIMDQTKELSRLKVREQSAREAIAYLSANPNLKAAAEVSLLLAYFAYLDASLRGQIPESYTQKTISWITFHSPSYKLNPHLTKKLHLYLKMVTHLNAKPYKLFRKIKIKSRMKKYNVR